MTKKSKSLKNALFTGSVITASLLSAGTASANTTNPFNFTDLGSGVPAKNSIIR